MFTEQDKKQILDKGLSVEKVNEQLSLFEEGIPFTSLVEAATLDNGIKPLNKKVIEHYISKFESQKNELETLKFVPASGAATRMFKFLFKFIKKYNPEEQSINSYINKSKQSELKLFIFGMDKFPFYNEVLDVLQKRGIDFDTLNINQKVWHFAHAMLDEDQLNFGNYPKGLLPFHEYKNNIVSTAFEEHLFETALYAPDNKDAKLHFTISERYKNKFVQEFERIEHKVEKKTESEFEIDFSYQQESTDTIAVDLKNKPFRNKDGSLLFRPSGHGALLTNLNQVDADIIFIKNIDNVVVYKYKDEVAKYKKVLAGILLEVQKKAFQYLNQLDEQNISDETLEEISSFLQSELNVRLTRDYHKYAKKYKIQYLRIMLNRPIRVCGMVKNEGEPGGGPFWIKNQYGEQSLQIVESAQINRKNKKQKEIFNNSTHFNPVDLVCGVKDYKGNKFDLMKFVDKKTAFITNKTKTGKELKALELPGLWNGSMAFWNSIFVEVPLITFNPVKTVNDLLKPAHQIK
ncbi:DUF4301 family protein [Winogradskyella sp. A3E31]|uniref:DUF4301 family protein n=1 Tax=Winogradskyella sp. A3E31 TaxID=3349637 RepID=UPI00398A7016